MAMANPTRNPRHRAEVVDLVSSDDSDAGSPTASRVRVRIQQEDSDDEPDAGYETPPLDNATPDRGFQHGHVDVNPALHDAGAGGNIYNIDGEEVFIPDDDLPLPGRLSPEPAAQGGATQDEEKALALDQNQNFTFVNCLERVRAIFPDVSEEYVRGLYNGFDGEDDYETLPGPARLDNIVEQLVAGTSYPKQEKASTALKRKRQDVEEEDSDKKWEQQNRIAVPNFLKGSMQAMLKAEFPDIPVQYINETLAAQKHLFQAFIALARSKENNEGSNRPYGRGRPSTKHLADATIIAANCGWPELIEELNAARRRVQVIRADKAADNAKKAAEQENIRKAMEAGETAECSACFEDLPMNRQIHCNGAAVHFTCFECALTYINSEVGESRCRVLCTAGCGAGFASNQLNLLSDKPLLEKLAQLQQEKDIRDAGLDNLEECPFCDYKAILPPIEEDFEFRCANPDCEKVSCRRCKSTSHIPLSCEQHAKDNKVNSRHKIEEAMSDAMIRSCNKCKKQFIKEYGCNKMSCPSCGNLQCYVCSTTLKGYDHFDQNPAGRTLNGGPSNKSKLCPLYDNVEERHEREVKEAEAAARAQAVEDNPDLNAEDLQIKVSDAVKKSAADRIKRAGGPAGEYEPMGFGMAGRAFRAVFGREDADEDLMDDAFDFHGDAMADMPHMPPARRRAAARLIGVQNDVRNRFEEMRRAVAREYGYVPRARDGAAAAAPAEAQPQAAPVAAHANGYVGALQGYIPILGFPNNQPPPQPPHPVNAPAQGFFGNVFQPGQQYDDPFGGAFGGFGGQVAPNQNNGIHQNEAAGLAQHQRQHNHHNHFHQPYNMPFPGAGQQLGVIPQRPEPLGDRARARQNFQHLEQLRQQHDLLMLNRELERHREEQGQRDPGLVDHDLIRHRPRNHRNVH